MQRFSKSAIAIVGAIATVTGTAAMVNAQDLTDWLYSGESAYHDISASAGAGIEANCDNDCTDVDLLLYDYYTGELVAYDTLVDAVPYVSAPYSGDFVLEVRMIDCYAEACAAWTYF
jgi:hypothetical protein